MKFYKVIKSNEAILIFATVGEDNGHLLMENDLLMVNHKYGFLIKNGRTLECQNDKYFFNHLIDQNIIKELNDFDFSRELGKVKISRENK